MSFPIFNILKVKKGLDFDGLGWLFRLNADSNKTIVDTNRVDEWYDVYGSGLKAIDFNTTQRGYFATGNKYVEFNASAMYVQGISVPNNNVFAYAVMDSYFSAQEETAIGLTASVSASDIFVMAIYARATPSAVYRGNGSSFASGTTEIRGTGKKIWWFQGTPNQMLCGTQSTYTELSLSLLSTGVQLNINNRDRDVAPESFRNDYYDIGLIKANYTKEEIAAIIDYLCDLYGLNRTWDV